MMRSLYSGVAGLNAHQTRMDVIGHNIANVNTIGYKKDRTTFQEMLAQMIRGPSAPTGDRGGINSMQVGLGVQVGSIDTSHAQGSLESTGQSTDLAIDGNGFFIVREGDEHHYTRAGNLSMDSSGFLVNSGNGLRLQGWRADTATGAIDSDLDLEDIRIPVGDTMEAEPSSYINFGGNLDADVLENGENSYSTTVSVYDELGSRHELKLEFVRSGDPDANQWQLTISNDATDDNDGSFLIDDEDNLEVTLEFSGGRLHAIDGEEDDNSLLIDLTDFYNGADPIEDLEINLEEITQFSGAFSAEATDLNGNSMGSLQSFTINDAGILVGTYTNGVNRNLGQVALAQFNNPEGLTKTRDTMFSQSANSGIARIGTPGSGGRGELRTAALEMSNVDLAEEFSNMIITQRGYQANSRIITTVDQMLQELVNMGR